MSRLKGAPIFEVKPGSLAEQLGLLPQDILLAVNKQPIQDLIDYQYFTAEEKVELDVLRVNGCREILSIDKEYDQDLGIRFDTAVFDGTRRCQNRCCFCFVDQLPSGLRSSLYVKDDDYRLSFLHGNFVTLSNLRDQDLERILKWHLSPLYVSVHTTDPQLRSCLMGNQKASKILAALKRLTEGGINIHAQIVLCPGLNDRSHLDRTIHDLGELGPNLSSVGIVPVGLTRFREGLPELRQFTPREAQDCLERIHTWQAKFQIQRDSRFVFLSDEFYLLAGVDFPPGEAYEDFPQIENGVGLARLFLDEFDQWKSRLPERLVVSERVVVVTGYLGGQVLKRVIPEFNRIENLEVNLHTVDNFFFGTGITVTGLLTGQDIFRSLFDKASNSEPVVDRVVIPEVMLKAGTTRFLDDWTVEFLEERLGIPVRVAPTSARGLIETVLDKKISRRLHRRPVIRRKVTG